MAWLSSLLIIRLFPYLDYHESVILQNNSLKDVGERLDSDNQINISRLISCLQVDQGSPFRFDRMSFKIYPLVRDWSWRSPHILSRYTSLSGNLYWSEQDLVDTVCTSSRPTWRCFGLGPVFVTLCLTKYHLVKCEPVQKPCFFLTKGLWNCTETFSLNFRLRTRQWSRLVWQN